MAQLPQRNEFATALQLAVNAACADGPASLKEAVNYAVLNGGKRIRPSVCFAVAGALQVSVSRVIPVAVAIELVHAQSLVHDDLPCMDDDDMRRGQPTVHKQFGEGIAVLVGDALLAQAFAVLTKPHPELTGDEQARLVFELSHTYQQLVSGQTMDLTIKLEPSSSTSITDAINRLKTAALFRFSVWSIGFLAKSQDLNAWASLGDQLGMLFQQCDDWHDTDWANDLSRQQAAAHIRQMYKALQASCVALHPRLDSLLVLINPVMPPLASPTVA
jgi:geranylgeranyl pyrophosphate synthase